MSGTALLVQAQAHFCKILPILLPAFADLEHGPAALVSPLAGTSHSSLPITTTLVRLRTV